MKHDRHYAGKVRGDLNRFFCIFLTLLTVLTALPMTAFAAGNPQPPAATAPLGKGADNLAGIGEGDTAPISAWWENGYICWYRDTAIEKYYINGYYYIKGLTSKTRAFSVRLNMDSADREL